MRKILVAVFMFLLFPLFSVGAGAQISCHCFQDRAFDPAQPAAADSYFLATTQNSLIATAFDVPKKSIVRAKMAGTDPDLLWVAYYVSDRTGLSFKEILAAYAGAANAWPGFAREILQSADRLDRPFVSALTNPADLEGLARGAYRSVMGSQLGIDKPSLDRLEMSGADRKEQILAVFIALLLAEDPADIAKEVRAGKRTWGQALAETGIASKQIEPAWQKLMKLHRSGF